MQQGVHPKVVLERLGHPGIGITLDTYSHVVPGMQKLAVAGLRPGFSAPCRAHQDGALVDPAHAHGLAVLSGLRAAAPWRDQPLLDVEIRDLSVYERLGEEVAHA